MKERPILFNGDMVRAILDGRKTQTRRIVKPQLPPEYQILGNGTQWNDPSTGKMVRCPYGQAGDRLWVREACRAEDLPDGADGVRYLADNVWRPIENTSKAACAWIVMRHYRGQIGATVPPIHMPRWASRITLEITGVRVERLNEISESDCWAEGIEACDGSLDDLVIIDAAKRMARCVEDAAPTYAALWESINGAGSWDANPWVWVVEFQRIEQQRLAA